MKILIFNEENNLFLNCAFYENFVVVVVEYIIINY